jgi:hypothetical protein
MSVEISFGGVCRDLALLPESESDLRAFYDGFVGPAIWEDFRTNCVMARGQGPAVTRAADVELQTRGCEVGGSVSIRF